MHKEMSQKRECLISLEGFEKIVECVLIKIGNESFRLTKKE